MTPSTMQPAPAGVLQNAIIIRKTVQVEYCARNGVRFIRWTPILKSGKPAMPRATNEAWR